MPFAIGDVIFEADTEVIPAIIERKAVTNPSSFYACRVGVRDFGGFRVTNKYCYLTAQEGELVIAMRDVAADEITPRR